MYIDTDIDKCNQMYIDTDTDKFTCIKIQINSHASRYRYIEMYLDTDIFWKITVE